VEFLEKPRCTKEELDKMMGAKVPVCDSKTGEKIDDIIFGDDEYRMLYREEIKFVRKFEAKNGQDLEQKVKEYLDSDKYKDPETIIEVVEMREVTVEELIEDEEKELYEQIFNRYLKMKLKPRKKNYDTYKELRQKYLEEVKYKYEMLRYINAMFEAEEFLGRDNNGFGKYLKDISAKEFINNVKKVTEENIRG
jgi:predicted RNase H-related nuclease YkuK (DUF458 family)